MSKIIIFMVDGEPPQYLYNVWKF